jgi:hypothetical protein
MGRTFLDIDMARAADLLGMERRQAEAIRDLERGEFLALGPAICRRPVSVRIGAVQTSTRMGTHSLLPMPSATGEAMQASLFDPVAVAAVSAPIVAIPEPAPASSKDLIEQIEKTVGIPGTAAKERYQMAFIGHQSADFLNVPDPASLLVSAII